MSTSERPDREASVPSSGFRWLILSTVLTTYALVVLGGVVRTTESGDACPDWPRCHGQLIPPMETDVLIEFSHRLLASVVGMLVLATAIAAWRWRRSAPIVFWGAASAVGLVIAQIILGGVTVLNDLSANLVTAHLALASALLATLVGIALFSLPPKVGVGDDERAGAIAFRRLAVFAALALFVLMLTGSYMAGAGAALAYRDWPLFDGSVLPEGGKLAMEHALHRFVAAAVGIIVFYLAYRALRMRWHRTIVTASHAAAAVYVVQVFVGAANIWTLLQPSAAAAHLALAAALWATLVAIALMAHRAASPWFGYVAEPVPAREARQDIAHPVPAEGGS
jgi:heme A synthase